jgi:biopolymer transport protein ExbD
MARRKYWKQRHDSDAYALQLTAMVDIMTIILIFLLNSYSTSAVQLTPADRLNLPASFSASPPIEALKMVVAKHGIYVDDKKIVDMKEGILDSKYTDAKDPQFIRALFQELDKQAQKTKDIAAKNEEMKFDGKIIVQVDRAVNYKVLKKALYTAAIAGYNDAKFAAVAAN